MGDFGADFDRRQIGISEPNVSNVGTVIKVDQSSHVRKHIFSRLHGSGDLLSVKTHGGQQVVERGVHLVTDAAALSADDFVKQKVALQIGGEGIAQQIQVFKRNVIHMCLVKSE